MLFIRQSTSSTCQGHTLTTSALNGPPATQRNSDGREGVRNSSLLVHQRIEDAVYDSDIELQSFRFVISLDHRAVSIGERGTLSRANNHRKKTGTSGATEREPIVCVLDDDADVRDGVKALLDSVGLRSRILSSPEEFRRENIDTANCLILDVRMPGVSGLEFQEELARAGIDVPIIFLSGHGDVPMAVKAMKGGAVEFLSKPFREQDLLDAVQKALAADRRKRNGCEESARRKARYESLSERERQVMRLVLGGLLNKQIANEMKLSEVTAKVHRAKMMRKLGLRTVADLAKAASALGIVAY
jgi:FixJ family two-component response regulator